MEFKQKSCSSFLEKQMKINQDGVSDWCNVSQLNRLVIKQGFRPIVGNGSPVFQNDRGLGKKYAIEKQMDDRGALEFVRTIGFCTYFQQNRGIPIPDEIRKMLKNSSCVFCGSSHRLEIDHKDGRKNPNKEGTINEFQAICKHCNGMKRERCKKCSKTNLRFDAKPLGYVHSVLIGSIKYKAAEEGCKGCYMHDPIPFRRSK